MKTSHFFGYLLGLLIFVIGIPALMWLVSGRPWPYAPDSTLLRVISVLFVICGLVLSIYSIVYMRIVGRGNPFDAYGHEVAPRTRHLMTGGPYGLCRNGKKVLVLAGKATPKVIREDKLCEILQKEK